MLVNADEKMKDMVFFDIGTKGLKPFEDRIIIITLMYGDEEVIFTNRDEATILKQFWKYLRRNNFKKIVGFNSDVFDIPMLVIRSIKHRIKMMDLTGRSLDIRKVIISDRDNRKGKLQDFKKLLDIEFEPSGYYKMHASILWEDPDNKELREFLLQDVRITWTLCRRLIEVGLID